jgi:hypothetical protein
MKMLNIPLTDLKNVMAQMTTESGGNVNAVNRTDSNAKAGHPSTGIFQLIASTFDAYAGPYRNTGPFMNGVSINPMAQSYAALNYAIHAYGMKNLSSVLGHGHGYSAGGVLPEKVIGQGTTSGSLYSFGSGEYAGPLGMSPAAANASGPTQQGMTQSQGMNLLTLIQQQNALLKQLPYALSNATRSGAAKGANHGAFGAQG